MADTPAPFVVEYEHQGDFDREVAEVGEHSADPVNYTRYREFHGRAAAMRFAKKLPLYWSVIERTNMHHVDRYCLQWEWTHYLQSL